MLTPESPRIALAESAVDAAIDQLAGPEPGSDAWLDSLPPPPPVERPRIAILLPHYGLVSVGVVDAILAAFNRSEFYQVTRLVKGGSSFLPGNFNDLLVRALNARDDGIADLAVMLHSDIVPEASWLRTLYGELWHHNADFMGTISPIKNPSGRTSTAIGDAADRWRVKRCLMLDELDALPETFGPEHVCGPGEVLLVNTGCWIADLRKPWWDDFSFDTHSKIIRHPDGRRETLCRTEDWELAHHLHEAGARVMVTRRVRLTHEGPHAWPNHAPTGRSSCPSAGPPPTSATR